MSTGRGRMIIAIALLLGLWTPPVHAEMPYFPEKIFSPLDKEENDFADAHFSSQLETLKEPSLWKLSKSDDSIVVFRFLWLATYEHPICIRISRAGEVVSLHVVQHDGHPGRITEKGIKIKASKDVKLSRKQWDKLVQHVEDAKFWVSPTEVKENDGIADGDLILIEGIKEGKYHVIERAGLIASDQYKALCRFMFELAEAEEIRVWDRHREDG